VTSARKIWANRANARASSGPKAVAGKAKSAQNAFRHGLNVPIFLDPDLASDVEALALRIVGKSAGVRLFELARRIAEAQVDLRRVRCHRNRLLKRAMAALKDEAEAAKFVRFEQRPAPGVKSALSDEPIQIIEANVSALVAEITKLLPELYRSLGPAEPSLAELVKQLAALDRYERRALSRRKFAIREFDLARIEAERSARAMGAVIHGGGKVD
jgi:hypothetical protein